MIQYKLSYTNPSTHYLKIEINFENINEDTFQLQLPSWRPGRYELANYARNVQKLQAFDENGNELEHEKVKKDLWSINTQGVSKLVVFYNYFAFQLDAGASYLDERQMYVNPVNCLMYSPKRNSDHCTVELKVSDDYQIATSLKKDGNILHAPDYDTLADSPFIASPYLLHKEYSTKGHNFHIWFMGEAKPEWDKIIGHFTAFTNEQLELFGELPVKEFHFLVQLPPFPFYHGVEHLASTVLCIGPGFDLMHERYQDFLGVSSHELFHSWNVKAIRPADMYPYDFTRENYSMLGYVAEGVTTYYGDYMLLRSKVWNFDEYANNFNITLQRHFHNYGRFNLSVAMSSFDTWLDGYMKGIPDRKVSIYVKGSIIALMLDLMIRRDTNDEKCLDDLMRKLYEAFGQQNRGYTEEDLKLILEDLTSREYDFFFKDFVHGIVPLEEPLQDCLSHIGCHFTTAPSENYGESYLGIKSIEKEGKLAIAQIAPNSPVSGAGISIDDILLAINGYEVTTANIHSLGRYFAGEKVELTVSRQGQTRLLSINPSAQVYFEKFQLEKEASATQKQKESFKKWCGQEF